MGTPKRGDKSVAMPFRFWGFFQIHSIGKAYRSTDFSKGVRSLFNTDPRRPRLIDREQPISKRLTNFEFEQKREQGAGKKIASLAARHGLICHNGMTADDYTTIGSTTPTVGR